MRSTPDFAPGVSHPEPGGLSVRQVLEVVAAMQAPYVVGGDVVELNPKLDRDGGHGDRRRETGL